MAPLFFNYSLQKGYKHPLGKKICYSIGVKIAVSGSMNNKLMLKIFVVYMDNYLHMKFISEYILGHMVRTFTHGWMIKNV